MKLLITCFFLWSCQLLVAQQELVLIDEQDNRFVYDIRYATTNNFMETVLYDCQRCLLRPAVAEALKKAGTHFLEKGYRIQIFDCYRPYSVQKAMWEKVPNAAYVANPYDKGSVHNRGAAIDLSLVRLDGSPVDMGTDYDFFGKEAHIDNTQLPESVLANRALLIEGMKQFGFSPIRTEWWHFSFKQNYRYEILDQPLPCKE